MNHLMRTACAVLLVCAAATYAVAAEPEAPAELAANRITGLRVPVFRDGAVVYELLAGEALYAREGRMGKITDVTIKIYKAVVDTEASLDAPPPLRMTITGDDGFYTVENVPNGEDAVYAELNTNVRVVHHGSDDETKEPGAVLTCNRAVWDSRAGTLTLPGDVELRRGPDTLTGSDAVYVLGDGRDETAGVLRLASKVRAVLHGDPLDDPKDKTATRDKDGSPETRKQPVVTRVRCGGVAEYRLADATATFSKDVVVVRRGVTVYSDNLRVGFSRRGRETTGEASAFSRIIAWGRVRIAGDDMRGSGEQAVYDEDARAIVITGTEDELPEMLYGEDRIRDRTLFYDMLRGVLTATGDEAEHGEAWLMMKTMGAAGEQAGRTVRTHVTYSDRLVYDRAAGEALFRGSVRLQREDLELESDVVRVEIPTDAESAKRDRDDDAPLQVRRVTAEGHVGIVTGDGLRVTTHRAVFDTRGDILRFSGTPEPVVEDPGRWVIRSRAVTIVSVGGNTEDDTDRKSIVRAEGPGEITFTSVDEAENAPETRIRFETDMEYDENRRRGLFTGSVVMTRDDLVLHADELEALTRPGRRDEGETADVVLSEARARGRVRMHHAKGRHSVSDRLVYEVDEEIITLLGGETEKAQVHEERGNSLWANRIVSRRADAELEAEGPGELVLVEATPEGATSRSALISFDGRLLYSGKEGEAAQAVFHRNVVLRWRDMRLRGDRLDVDLGAARNVTDAVKEDTVYPSQTPTLWRSGLRSAVMTGSVQIIGQGRDGYGKRGVFRKAEEQFLLSGDDEDRAEIHDQRGMRMSAPEFDMRYADGRIRANGPGRLCVAGLPSLDAESVSRYKRDATRPPGADPFDYVLDYDGTMDYNTITRRAVFTKNVRMRQGTLRIRSDTVDALLAAAPESDAVDESTPPLRMRRVKCEGSVELFRLEPPRQGETIEDVLRAGASIDRTGSSVNLRSDLAVFDIPKDTVVFSKKARQTRVLVQEVDGSGSVSRRFVTADVITLNRRTGGVTAKGNPRFRHLPAGGPFEFPEGR